MLGLVCSTSSTRTSNTKTLSRFVHGSFLLVLFLLYSCALLSEKSSPVVERRAHIPDSNAGSYVDEELLNFIPQTVETPRFKPSEHDRENDCLLALRAERSCIRLLLMERETDAGLGHQITEFLTSLRLGALLKMTPVVSRFEPVPSNHGEDYVFMNDLVGFKVFVNEPAANLSNLRTVNFADVKDGDCDILVKANMNSCKRVNCFHSPSTRLLFQEAASCTRQVLLPHSSWLRRNPFSSAPNTFNVVWHIRVGDIQLHPPGDKFYETILSEVQVVLADFSEIKHTFIGAWHQLNATELHSYKSFFASIIPLGTFIECSTQDSLLYMMHSDMLIGSGSSLPLVAALFSNKTLYVNSQSRKPGHEGWGFLGDYIDGITADYSGNLYEHPSEIRSKIKRVGLVAKLRVQAHSSYFRS